jgi:hypothetical protein
MEKRDNTLLNILLDKAEKVADANPDRYINRTKMKRYSRIFEKSGRITKEKAAKLRKEEKKPLQEEVKPVEEAIKKPIKKTEAKNKTK